MAKNKKYWKTLLASSADKKHAATTGEDPLEEGLKQLTWFESSKQAVRRGINKTYETFGEEVGNSITSGVVVLYLLGLLPFAAINTYLRVTAMDSTTQAHVCHRYIGFHHHLDLSAHHVYGLPPHEARHSSQESNEQGQQKRCLLCYPWCLHAYLHQYLKPYLRRSPLGSGSCMCVSRRSRYRTCISHKGRQGIHLFHLCIDGLGNHLQDHRVLQKHFNSYFLAPFVRCDRSHSRNLFRAFQEKIQVLPHGMALLLHRRCCPPRTGLRILL